MIWALLVSLTSSAWSYSLIHYASAVWALFTSNLPNLFLPQGLCAGYPVCLENPMLRCLRGSLIHAIHSDLIPDVAQRDFWPPSLKQPHLPNHCHIPLIFHIVILSHWHYLVLICFALPNCESLATGTSVLLKVVNPPVPRTMPGTVPYIRCF